MIYGHLPDWIFARTDLTSASKIVLMRMIGLSQDGKRTIFFQYKKHSKELGMSERTLIRSVKQLAEASLIFIAKKSGSWDKTNYFSLSEKAYFDNDTKTLDMTEGDKMSLSKVTKCHYREGQTVTVESDKMSPSSSDRSIKKDHVVVVEDLYAREKNNNSDNAPALNDIPLPDDSDFYETEENKEPEPDLNDLYGTECTYNAQEPANLPQTTNYTSNTNNTPSMQSSNEIEGVRRQLTIPSSADELIPLIEKFKAAHKAEKVFDDLDVRFYAGKIFDYYAGADGVWRDNKGNEVPPYRIFNKISSWIVNDQMNGKLHRIISSGTMTSADLSKAMDEIAEKNKREKLALMQKFGIKPPPIDVSCEEVENDENNNEPKLLEAK